jgi:hypothetical protein
VTSYQLYAANKVTTGACPISDNDKGDNSLRAGPVGSAVTTDLRETMIDVSFATSVIATRAGRGACDADGVIEVCVQALSGGTDVGTARGTLQLSLAKPAAPALQSVTPGEQALNVDWDAPNPGAGESYEAFAVTTDPSDPAFVGTQAIHSSGRATATDARVADLVNFAVYQVHVIAYSDADNPSDPSNVVTSSPLPVDDFFEAYKKAGGRETGGCASGGVGLLALAGVASLLVLRRRS